MSIGLMLFSCLIFWRRSSISVPFGPYFRFFLVQSLGATVFLADVSRLDAIGISKVFFVVVRVIRELRLSRGASPFLMLRCGRFFF
jgi:hypothetical protein